MEVKYYVNEEKRTIVAVLENPKRNLVLNTYANQLIYFADEETDLLLEKTYVGKAVCSPEDPWNEELGKRLARRRAYDKYLKNRGRKMLDAIDLVDKKMKPIIEASAKALSQWENFDANEI